MKTERFKDGNVTHSHSDAMVALAEKWLLEYLTAFGPKMPGDMEDDLCGEVGLGEMLANPQGRWRKTPFYPALARLVEKGAVRWYSEAGYIRYSLAS